MEMEEVLREAQSSLAAGKVFGQPYEKDGITVIPAAMVRAGGGGGRGEQTTERRGLGTGMGYGLAAKPIGAYVIKNGDVTWRPVVDVSRVVAIAGAAFAAAMFAMQLGRRPRRLFSRFAWPRLAARGGILLRLGKQAW